MDPQQRPDPAGSADGGAATPSASNPHSTEPPSASCQQGEASSSAKTRLIPARVDAGSCTEEEKPGPPAQALESQSEPGAGGQEQEPGPARRRDGEKEEESEGQGRREEKAGTGAVEAAAGAGPATTDVVNTEAEAEALARAEALKREGNELFGRGAWAEAAAKYNEALDAAPASAAKQRAIYFANLAACNIKTEEYGAAVQNCTSALELDASYGKARVRRCEAFERLDELDHALSDAKEVLAADPDSAWARAKVAALQPKVDERTEKLKAEMLGKLKELGNTILGKFGLSTDNFKFDKDPNTGSYSIRFER